MRHSVSAASRLSSATSTRTPGDATGGAVGSVYVQDLGETYWQDYAKKIDAVTTDDLARVAKKYIDLDKINILIVGDRAVIEEPLRKTGIAPIVILDAEGKAVP